MAIFQLLINGENLLLEVDGERRKMGFYTTRIVSAPDSESAGQSAIASLRNELRQDLLNSRDDQPVMSVEESQELHKAEAAEQDATGIAWYEEDDEPTC